MTAVKAGPMSGTVVIVGSSVGGVQTALSLRDEGHEGRIVVIGAEPDLPYDKPPLSKQFLTGAFDEGKLRLLSQEAADQKGIELWLERRATSLDVPGHAVVLESGQRVDYDSLVIATGAFARPSPWGAKSGVSVLRTLDDGRILRDRLKMDEPVIVIGGGFIGAEVAASARAVGRQVTVIDPLPLPISRIVGQEIGGLFRDLHAKRGVDVRFGLGVESVEGNVGDLRVMLTDGQMLEAGTAVVGIGTIPHDDWLRTSGLRIEDGIVCDHYGRAAPATGVFAVGDVARWFQPERDQAIRSEHWTAAVDQATCVAHNIARPDDLMRVNPTDYIWSDQYDWRIQIVGRTSEAARHVTFGDKESDTPRFAALCQGESGLLIGAVTVNWPKALRICMKMLKAGADFEMAEKAVVELPSDSAAVSERLTA